MSSGQCYRRFCRKSLPADSRHSNAYELCPSSCRHLSVFIRSGIHTIFALNEKETFNISVQSHLQVHRWCILHKQTGIRKLSGPDVSCWTLDQGHHREHHSASFLDLLLSIGRDYQLYTSTYDKRDDFNFHKTHLSFLSSNIQYSPVYGGLISQLMRYNRSCYSYECFILGVRRLSSKLLEHGYLFIQEVVWSIRGPYSALWSLPLTNIKCHSDPWSVTVTTIGPDFYQFYDIDSVIDLHWITSSFHGAFATGVTCQQGTLPLPDTWFLPPFLDLFMLQLLRLVFQNLCLFSTFRLE